MTAFLLGLCSEHEDDVTRALLLVLVTLFVVTSGCSSNDGTGSNNEAGSNNATASNNDAASNNTTASNNDAASNNATSNNVVAPRSPCDSLSCESGQACGHTEFYGGEVSGQEWAGGKCVDIPSDICGDGPDQCPCLGDYMASTDDPFGGHCAFSSEDSYHCTFDAMGTLLRVVCRAS